MKFRKLRADEIDVRVGNCFSWGYTLLLYKDARCDMNILDETVGAENWQRDHKEVKGNLYCGVGINQPIIQTSENGSTNVIDRWSWKWDCGTESNTEKEKGEASDSFKRACVNWGIGRELYTSPQIRIFCDMNIKTINGKEYYEIPYEEKKRRFVVSEITYNEKNEIENLIIRDNNDCIAFATNFENKPTPQEKKKSQYSGYQCELCTEDISDKVADYSKKKFGKMLCYDCQKKVNKPEVVEV